MKTICLLAVLFSVILTSCDQNKKKVTFSNSVDTNNVTKAGGPPIRDTATINKDRRDSAKLPGKSSTAKGNADPAGHIKNQ